MVSEGGHTQQEPHGSFLLSYRPGKQAESSHRGRYRLENGDMCKRICVWISNASPENTHTSILLKAFRCPDLVQYLHLLDYLVV